MAPFLNRRNTTSTIGLAMLLCFLTGHCAAQTFTSLTVDAFQGNDESDRIVSVIMKYPSAIALTAGDIFRIDFDLSQVVTPPQSLATGGSVWCAYLTGKDANGNTKTSWTSFSSACTSSTWGSTSERYIQMTVAVASGPFTIAAGETVSIRFWKLTSTLLGGTVTVKHMDSVSTVLMSGSTSIASSARALVPVLGPALVVILSTLAFLL